MQKNNKNKRERSEKGPLEEVGGFVLASRKVVDVYPFPRFFWRGKIIVLPFSEAFSFSKEERKKEI